MSVLGNDYVCERCGCHFQRGALSCLVLHGPNECCHYGDKRLDANHQREPVICASCGWTLRNDGEYDLEGEECGYQGCREPLHRLSSVIADREQREMLVMALSSPETPAG